MSGVIRKLAAILCADVVGYSRLMGQDEAGTLATMKAHRQELWGPLIERHGGRVVGTAGDGILVEFASAVAAVENAVAVQQGMIERNADLPDDRQMLLRVGVNMGEVIVDGDDLFGDGVNIAARLQEIAEPGGIAISDIVRGQVHDKIDADFVDDGARQVKNIVQPLHVWRWSTDPVTGSSQLSVAAPPDRPSIAVLPFNNMSGDAEQEYFSDGIAEDIITDLSKISGLFVIARNSSFTYKGQSVDVRRAAEELGVRYILEGSVRRAANRVRITAQLVEGASGGHLWAERYDRELDDIFAIQDEITGHVVEALKITLRLGEQERIGGQATSSIEAYDITLRASNLLYRHTPDSNAEAAILFEQAIALDPKYIAPHFGFALTLFNTYANSWSDDPASDLERACQLAAKAIELDPMDPQGHWAMALGHFWRRDLDKAISEAERAIELGPNYAEAYAIRGYVMSFASRPAEAVESLNTAMRLDPKCTDLWLHFLAHAHFVHADYEEAIALLQRRIQRQPETDISRVLLASCYGQLGRESDAQEEWARALEINPDYSIEQKARILPYKNPADWERFVEGLRKAGVPVA